MKSAAILFVIPAVAAFCHHGTSLFKKDQLSKRADGTFGFDGLNGPLNWHSISSNNSACALGRRQSPINVKESNTKQVQGSTITFTPDQYPEGGELENLSGFLEVRANGTMKNGGKTYNLRQFHFHTPSEHRINGEHFPLEVHFVWEAKIRSGSSIAVVGFPIEVAETSDPLLAAVFKNVNQVTEFGSHAPTGPLDFTSLSEHVSKNTIHQYTGSLTTPPCTESIAWNVVGSPIPLDIATYLKTKSIMKYNARYTQNSPGKMNLLENAYKSLKTIIEGGQAADPEDESPCKKKNKKCKGRRKD